MSNPHAKMIMAPSGRYAIFARLGESSPWVQVESINGEDNATRFIRDLEDYDDRASYIEDCDPTDMEWGRDAPLTAPNA